MKRIFAFFTLLVSFTAHASDGVIEIYQPARLAIPAIVDNIEKFKLHAEGQLDFRSEQIVKYMNIEGSITLSDVISIYLNDDQANKEAASFVPDVYMGYPDLEILLHAKWKHSGKLSGLIDFKYKGEKSVFPVLIQSKAFGEIGLRITELSWEAEGLLIKTNKPRVISLSATCGIIQDKTPIACSAQLQYNVAQNRWFYHIKLKPDLKIPDQYIQPKLNCSTDIKSDHADLVRLMEFYKSEDLEFPYISHNPNHSFVDIAQSSENRKLNISASLYVRPKFQKIEIPGAPYGLFVNVPENSIISLCMERDNVIVNFFEIKKKYKFWGEKVIVPSKVNISWSVIPKAYSKVKNLVDDIPGVNFFLKPLEVVAKPVLAIPQHVIRKLVPISGINQLVITPKEVNIKLDGLVIKKVDVELNSDSN